MKILIADKFEASGIAALEQLGCTVISQPDLTAEQLPDALVEHAPQVLIVRSTKVRKPAIDAARAGGSEGLKCIIRAGAGYDNIDLDAASARSIAVCNCPGTNSVAVAELVMGLLLCCDRRIPDQTQDVKNGVWNKKEYAKARGLKGMTLGVIGVGGIGREVISRARAFEMNVVAHSLHMTPERAMDLKVGYGGSTREELYEMLGKCDAVSVHVAANAESDRLCDERFFDAMKPGAYFINTSRGSVMDGKALERAVREKGIRCGLDVYTNEPAEAQTTWTCEGADLPGVYMTHHVGASTDQAQNAVAEEAVRIVKELQDHGTFRNRVNTDAPTVAGSGARAAR